MGSQNNGEHEDIKYYFYKVHNNRNETSFMYSLNTYLLNFCFDVISGYNPKIKISKKKENCFSKFSF